MPNYVVDFQRLARRIEDTAHELAPAVGDDPGLEARSREHEEAMLAEASSLRTELDHAAQTWIVEGTLPTLPPRTRRFLFFRFLAAFRFLDLLSLSSDEPSVFRVADMRERQFLHWILCEWGHEHGTIEGLSHQDYAWFLHRDWTQRQKET